MNEEPIVSPILGFIPLIAVIITGLLALGLVRYSWQGQKRRALVPDGA